MIVFISCENDDNPVEGGTLLLDQEIRVGSIERNYHIYLPEGPENKPLVMLLHGNGGNFNQSIGKETSKAPQQVWLSIAAQEGFMVVVPNGSLGPSNSRGWNDCRTDAQGQTLSDDVVFLTSLLEQVKTDYNYDEKKVYVAGISNGGFMAQRLAQEIPEKITAFAAVIAAMSINTECDTSMMPVSALIMNGTEDPIVPYDGGAMAFNRGEVLATNEIVDYWLNRNGINENPVPTVIEDLNPNDGCKAMKYLYQNGRDNTEVALYKIVEGGHTEPSIEERFSNAFLLLVGNQNGDFEMAQEIWAFFNGKTR